MAIIGHWFSAFLVAYFVPDASVTWLMKLTMLSDSLSAIFMLTGVEHAGIYAQWLMSTPPPGTLDMVEDWKAHGKWQEGVDLMPGEAGFAGFGLAFGFYVDLAWSHSVELMALLAVGIFIPIACARGASKRYAMGILLCLISHPLLDMIFHDATFCMGNRSKTRVNLGLWQHNWLVPFTVVLEILMAYLPYRLWLSSREPASDEKRIADDIAYYQKFFWSVSLQHNMVSWYVLGPLLQWGFYTYTSWDFAANNFWSYALVGSTLMSWTAALYPMAKLEALLPATAVDRGSADGFYVKVL